VFVPGKLFKPGLMLAVKVRAYTSEAPFRCSQLEGRFFAFLTSIRLGWKGLLVTNTSFIWAFIYHLRKSFKTLRPLGPML